MSWNEGEDLSDRECDGAQQEILPSLRSNGKTYIQPFQNNVLAVMDKLKILEDLYNEERHKNVQLCKENDKLMESLLRIPYLEQKLQEKEDEIQALKGHEGMLCDHLFELKNEKCDLEKVQPPQRKDLDDLVEKKVHEAVTQALQHGQHIIDALEKKAKREDLSHENDKLKILEEELQTANKRIDCLEVVLANHVSDKKKLFNVVSAVSKKILPEKMNFSEVVRTFRTELGECPDAVLDSENTKSIVHNKKLPKKRHRMKNPPDRLSHGDNEDEVPVKNH